MGKFLPFLFQHRLFVISKYKLYDIIYRLQLIYYICTNIILVVFCYLDFFEIRPTAFESLLISSVLNSSFELTLYGSISIGSLLIGFALTFGFTERDVLDFRSRFLEPEVVLDSEDRLGLLRDDCLSCTFDGFYKLI